LARDWREPVCETAGRLFLPPNQETLFRHGFSQADLHPGNFRFRKTPRDGMELVLYDFGCGFRAPLPARLGLLRLIGLTEANASEDLFPLFLELGFDPGYPEPITEKVPALCRILFAPFIVKGPW